MSSHLWTNPYAFVTDGACNCGLTAWAMRKGRWLNVRLDAEERLCNNLQAQVEGLGILHGATFSASPDTWHLTLDITDSVNPLYPVELAIAVREALTSLGVIGVVDFTATPITVDRYLFNFTYGLGAQS